MYVSQNEWVNLVLLLSMWHVQPSFGLIVQSPTVLLRCACLGKHDCVTRRCKLLFVYMYICVHALIYMCTCVDICDRICENVHSSHIHFFNFECSPNLFSILERHEIYKDCSATILLLLMQISDLYVYSIMFYEPLNV